jgi:hypothetical protein
VRRSVLSSARRSSACSDRAGCSDTPQSVARAAHAAGA